MTTEELLQKSKNLIESKQYSMAKEYAQAALEKDQNDTEALFLLAQCDELLGKTKAMASSLFKILSIDTSNVHALEKLRNTGFLGKDNANDEVELVEKISDDGSVYLLSMRGDKVDGFGAMMREGMLYAGMFKDGDMHGHGLFKGSDGDIYVGNFNNGIFEGEGTLITEYFQAKTTFNGTKPDGKSPVEIKWENGNRVVFQLNGGQIGDISRWSNVVFFGEDGSSCQVDIDNGDSVNIVTGEVFLWKDDEDFRESNWGDNLRTVLSTENSSDIQQDKNYISYKAIIAGFVCVVMYMFENNRLTNGAYMVSQEYDDPQQFARDYNKFAEFFNMKYGRPTKRSHELIWYVNAETILKMPKWKSGTRRICAIYSPSLI